MQLKVHSLPRATDEGLETIIESLDAMALLELSKNL